MAYETIGTRELTRNTADLLDFLDEHLIVEPREFFKDVYVTDDDGRHFTRATLERETLSDGSSVLNLILS